MRIITGDECGLLKESIPEVSRASEDGKKKHQNAESGVSRLGNTGAELNMNRSMGIVDLAFSQLDSSNEDVGAGSLSFCALRANGSLERWEGFSPYDSKEDRICGGTYKMSNSMANVFEPSDKSATEYQGRPIAMCSAHQYQTFSDKSSPNNIVACCSSIGRVSVIDTNNFGKGIVAQYDAYSKGNRAAPSKISHTRGQFENRDIATAMAMSTDAQKIVIGGRERAATMLDVESGKNLWKSKNLPPNRQTLLQQPIWATAIQFLSKTDTSPVNGSTDLLAIGTAYKQLQIYDIRTDATQRRPVLYTPEWDSTKDNLLEHRVTSLCQLDSNRIVVGDSAGFMHTLDMRKFTKNNRSLSASVGRFSGPAGSVRQIVKHETLPIIACVGLDRMVRTFDTNKRTQIDCVYLKQRLNCMLFCSDGTWDSKGSLVGEEEEEPKSEEEEDVDNGGNIDDEDEVKDYVDSSGDEDSEGEEIDSDGTSELEEEAPISKRQRK